MSVTTAAPAVASRGSALGRLTVAELKLLLRERVRLFFGVGFPLILLIIFGSIPSFNRPSTTFGGYTTLDAYIPILIAFSLALLSLTALPMTLAAYRERGSCVACRPRRPARPGCSPPSSWLTWPSRRPR